jgi:hypothetical protein
MDLAGPRKRDPAVHLRRVLVHSTASAAAAASARALKLRRARAELDTLVRTAGSRYHPGAAAITARIGQIARKHRIAACLRTQITTGAITGKPSLAWHYDQETLAAQAAADGWYALLANAGPAGTGTAHVLIRYKGQPHVERRYSDFKGPLAVAPMFLHTNRRIAALITVICLALLVFCLIERQVRQALAPATDLAGFYTCDNRAVRPTGRLILTALSRIQLRTDSGQPPQILIPGPIQKRLLTLLKIDPTRPRWLTE